MAVIGKRTRGDNSDDDDDISPQVSFYDTSIQQPSLKRKKFDHYSDGVGLVDVPSPSHAHIPAPTETNPTFPAVESYRDNANAVRAHIDVAQSAGEVDAQLTAENSVMSVDATMSTTETVIETAQFNLEEHSSFPPEQEQLTTDSSTKVSSSLTIAPSAELKLIWYRLGNASMKSLKFPSPHLPQLVTIPRLFHRLSQVSK